VNGPAGIIWLASFPKSGNTWFRALIANLDAGEGEPADINDLSGRGGIASSRHEFEAVTMLDSALLTDDDIDRLRPEVYAHIAAQLTEQRWIKAHDAYALNADGVPTLGRGVARRAVYLVRDPRDVAVSYSHHANCTLDEAVEMLNTEAWTMAGQKRGMAVQLRQRLLGWSGHAASWLDQTDTPVRLVRYEDMRADPAGVFAAALAFAERAATPEEVARAVRHADFAELKQQESEKGFRERQSPGSPFFRAGEVGGWREALTQEQVARIETAHGPMMRRLGYALSLSDAA
jgi:hypothetical protein